MKKLSTMEAILIGITSIEQRTDIPEQTKQLAIERLTNLSKRDWFVQWDKESIIAALQKFKNEHGYAPTVTNLSETGMPSNLTIQSHFNVKASSFLSQLFPENREISSKKKKRSNCYGFNTEEDWMNCFIEQFNKHLNDGMSARKYNILRDNGTPTWDAIARHCNVQTWSELMAKANVKYNKKVVKTATNINIVDVSSPFLDKLEHLNDERKQLNKELYEILTKHND